VAGCDKEDDPSGSDLKSFTELVADKDTLIIGESTTIRAIYEGENITFEWDVTSGNLLGGGDQVEYHVAMCDVGVNTVSCKAIVSDTSITRTINIVVNVQ
jgi:hypothetical protein